MFIWPRRADRNTQVINKSSEQNRWHQAADLVPMATVDGAGSWLLCCLWRVEVVRCFPLGKPPRHPAAVRENNSARVEKLLKIRRLYNNIIIQFKSLKRQHHFSNIKSVWNSRHDLSESQTQSSLTGNWPFQKVNWGLGKFSVWMNFCMIVLSVRKSFHYNHLSNVLKVIMLSSFPLPAAQNPHPPMAPSPTRPNATETGSMASWTSSPACCPSPRRSGLGWTSCPCSASASDTWRSRASSTVSVQAVDLSLRVSPRTESPEQGHTLDREFCLLYKVVQYTNIA